MVLNLRILKEKGEKMTHISKKISIAVMAIVFVVAMCFSMVILPSKVYADNSTIYVSKTGNDATGSGSQENPYATIQAAIDAANPSDGDTINVAAGTYDLTASIIVNKSVSIIGDINNPENVVINAGNIAANSGPKSPGRDRDAFQVAANNVVIKGFKIINALNLMTGSGDGWQNAGITVGGDITLIDWLDPFNKPLLIDGGTFSNNIIENCSIGIYLAMSKNVIVSDNVIRNSTIGSGNSYSEIAGVGIMNWNTKASVTWQDPVNNIIEGNVVEYSDRTGICLGAWDPDIFSVGGTVIKDNTIRYSGQRGNNPGIDLMYVTGPLSITGNDIYSNTTGIGVGPKVSGVEAQFNNIYNNTAFGVNVWDQTGTSSINATNNWWGSATGPTHSSNSDGTGDAVSDNVLFDPWYIDAGMTRLSNYVAPATPAKPAGYVQQTVGAGTNTVDASSVAGAYSIVTGSGGQTVTIEGISSATASAGGFYIEGATTYVDLHLDTPEGVEQIQFTILGGAGVPMWWDGSSWIECLNYTIDAAGNVTVTITGSTTPSLSDLTGTVFTVVGKPTTPVEIETVRTNPFTCWKVFVNDKNNFQLIFFWPYKNNNWLKIYDMNDKLVFQKDLAYNDPAIEVSLPDGMYKVKTYHDNWDKPLQEFIIGKP